MSKVALITGGARGQGRAHATTLARAGADIVICDVADQPSQLATVPYPLATSADVKETIRLVEAEGRSCLAVTADVRDTAQVQQVVDAALERYGRIDVLVANAGICTFGPVTELGDDTWDETIGTNLTGVFKAMRAVVPVMAAQGDGRIVATSSMGGRMGMRNLAHYVAAKWGVIGLVKSVALEVAERGITVNAVCPAAVDTPMVHNPALYGLFCPGLDQPDRDDVRPIYEGMNPMRVAWLDPQEVAAAVAYLASDAARSISGSVIELSLGGSAYHP